MNSTYLTAPKGAKFTTYAGLQDLWTQIYTTYPPGLIEFTLLVLVQIFCFWIPAALLLALDLTFPAFSNRHKIQSERRQPSWSQIKHCITHVAVNNINSTVLHFVVLYFLNFEKTLFCVTPELPPIREVVWDFVCAALAREVLFYYVHRALHDPRVYRFVHKQHHKFTAPISFAAQYAHPLEHIFANVLPHFLPLIYLRAHIVTFIIYLGYSLLETTATHSGYDFFAFPLKANMHDLHHEKFNVNFGALGFLDWWHGTFLGQANRAVVGQEGEGKKEL